MPAFSIAIIGGGGISRAHINAAGASNGRITIAGIVDPSPDARQAAATAAGSEAFETLEALFASVSGKSLDGLIICTPPSARIPYVEAALKRNLAVMTEKPLAHTLEDAQKLVNLAAKHPQTLTAVGYCHRFTPAMVEIKRRIFAGDIGEIVRIENTFASAQGRLKNHWMSDRAVSGGGACIDTACHSLDLLLYLIGPAKTRGAIFKNAWPGRAETSATILLDAGGVAAVINSGWAEPPAFVVTVIGTSGLLHYDYNRPAELICRGLSTPAETIAVETHEVRFARQLEAFADIAQGKSPAVRPATFAEALETAKAVDSAIKLAASS